MSGFSIAGDSSGSVNLVVPSVAGSNTATLPASTGTVMVSGNMPAFSAYANTNSSFTSSTFAKININTKIFDTASAFDNTTNYRFTPQVAGYYQVNGVARIQTTAGTLVQIAIYKNGSIYCAGSLLNFAVGSNSNEITVSEIVYLNGSTDYIELWGYADGASPSFNYNSTANTSRFSACMMRSA